MSQLYNEGPPCTVDHTKQSFRTDKFHFLRFNEPVCSKHKFTGCTWSHWNMEKERAFFCRLVGVGGNTARHTNFTLRANNKNNVCLLHGRAAKLPESYQHIICQA